MGAAFILGVLTFLVWSNSYVNETKLEKCHKLGGTYSLNQTHADRSFCTIPPKPESK